MEKKLKGWKIGKLENFAFAKIIVFVLGFVMISKMAIAQVATNEEFTSTPWYKIPWLWLGILAILGGIIVYVTFWKSK